MPYQRPDHYTRKAKAEGFAARSVFKLEEIAQRVSLPRSGVALDLGCAPGSWSRWLQQRGFHVVGVDLVAPAFAGHWIVGSALDIAVSELAAALGGPADLVCSDMAPNTSGDRFTDHCRQLALAERALSVAEDLLRPGGALVVKVFDGGDAPAFVASVRERFGEVKRIKPAATRGRSVEFFVVGTGYRRRESGDP